MTGIEILIDLLDDLSRDVQREIEPLSLDELGWQPTPQSNNIGVTVWHFCRWLDLLTVQAFQGRPPEEERWHVEGWTAQTGYDPRGIGYQGFGAITGYSWEEVQAVPTLSAQELLQYFEQVSKALREYLLTLSSEDLDRPVKGFGGRRTVYEWIKPILKGCFWHVGEIQALKAMRDQLT